MVVPKGLLDETESRILSTADYARLAFAAKLEAWALNYSDDRGERYHELIDFISRVEQL